MSTVRRGGLGKGLGALIPTSGAPASGVAIDAILGDRQAPVRVPGASFQEIPVTRVVPNPRQPRQHFDEDALAELQASIAAFGLLQPIVVRPSGDVYELVMGERRWRAAKEIGLDAVPAIVRDTADDAMLRDALLENLHRQQLNPLEEAAAYQQLLQEFGSTHEDLASRIGRSRSQVSNTIRLLNLPVPVQRRVAAGVLSAGHARALLALADGDRQEELAGRIVAEGLSVRATEELVSVGGVAPPPGRPPRAIRLRAPALVHLAEQLSDAFDTSVKVELGRRKGRVVVEFASVDDLQRIIALMSPAITQRAKLTDLSTVDSAGPDRDVAAEPAPDDPAAAGDQSTVDMREGQPAPAATTDSGRHAAAESESDYEGVRP